jgi:predicted aldo/keto reductase-like oxidoreductase
MLNRREWLRALALVSGSAFVGTLRGAEESKAISSSDRLGPRLPERNLGATGLKVSLLACGGSHVGRPDEAEAERIIETAIEQGIRTFETAQVYQNGGSEQRYGKYLTPKYREHVLIFTKTMASDARTAEAHLEGSLRRMKLDYLDLWQMHDIRSEEDFDERQKNGVLDYMLKAKANGKVRHIGFSGHATWRAHAHVLQRTDVFETCLMPINVADPSYESFILNILPTLVQRNMGVLAMKTLAAGDFLRGRGGLAPIVPNLVSIEDALRFVWSLPVSSLVSGLGRVEHVLENAGYAARFTPLNEAQRAELIARVAEPARTGRLEANFKNQR